MMAPPPGVEPPAHPTPIPTERRANRMVLTVVLILVSLVLLGLGYFLYKNHLQASS